MARLPASVTSAINRQIHRGDAFDRWSRKNYGIPGRHLAAKLVSGESGGNMGAVSSAGARGITQFIPSTRNAFLQRYGVDAWKNPDSAIKAMKLHLTTAGGVRGYNPGMPSYQGYILGQKIDPGQFGAKGRAARRGRKGRAAQAGLQIPGGKLPGVSIPTLGVQNVPGYDVKALRKERIKQFILNGEDKRDPSWSTLFADIGEINKLPQADFELKPGSIKTKGESWPGVNVPGREGSRGTQIGNLAKGQRIIMPGQGYAGTQGGIKSVTRGFRVSSEKRATVNTASGNVSDHYIGNKSAYARDLPATGAQGERIARAVAKRMGIKNYRTGNFNGYTIKTKHGTYRAQILWNVKDHYDHVHVGLKRIG